MINKETLLKKIENGETVWYLRDDGRIMEFSVSKEYRPAILYGDMLSVQANEDSSFRCRLGLDKIYATKEEAEWELEFGNITRTEKLELPSWEDVQNGKQCYFSDKYHNKNYSFGKSRLNGKRIFIGENYFTCNYDGYIAACRLCKKLFLGDRK